MATVGQVEPVKLICGMISADTKLFVQARDQLLEQYGPVDQTSDPLPFDFTHYYDDQMGSPLHRKFVAFERLIDPSDLATIKRATNGLEDEFSASPLAASKRPVNLDPGYVAPSKLVLGSMKDFSHRVYLADGVYAVVTLQYHHGGWESLPWTFPDYASGRYDAFLTAVRERLCEQHKQETCR